MQCTACGFEIAEGVKFCENCGSPVAAEAPAAVEAAVAAAVEAAAVQAQQGQAQGQPQGGQYWQGGAGAQQPGQQPDWQYQQPSYQQPAPRQWPEQPATSRALAMSVYIGGLIVLIIGLVVRDKDDAFLTHHLNQALVIFIGFVISGILSFVLIGGILGIYLLVMMIMGMVRAYNSSTEELPLIGKIHILG